MYHTHLNNVIYRILFQTANRFQISRKRSYYSCTAITLTFNEFHEYLLCSETRVPHSKCH